MPILRLQSRHYNFLADVLSKHNYNNDTEHYEMVNHFANELSKAGDNFNKDEFIKDAYYVPAGKKRRAK
jgi:flagellin-specific chaperone FliS